MKLKQTLVALFVGALTYSGVAFAEGEATVDHRANMVQAVTAAIAAASAGNLEEVKAQAKVAMEEGETSLGSKQDFTVDKAIPLMRGAKEHAEAGHAEEAKKSAEEAMQMLNSTAPVSDAP